MTEGPYAVQPLNRPVGEPAVYAIFRGRYLYDRVRYTNKRTAEREANRLNKAYSQVKVSP